MKLSALLAENPHLRRREAVLFLSRPIESARIIAGDPEIEDITFDSRDVRPGTLFVALVGAASDGHRYIANAIERGAVAVLVNEDFDEDVRGAIVLDTDDTRARLGALADTFYGHPSSETSVIGVTGTNGKTTVTFLLESVLEACGWAPGVLGTVNYRWPGHTRPAPNTTPESLVVHELLREMVDDDVRAVAMEVSSHGLATHRVESVLFDVAVFTNLTQDHLDFHDSMEEYRDAKASLFTEHLSRAAKAGKSPVAVLNVDDDEGRRLAGLALEADVVTYSASGADATWSAREWSQDLSGTHAVVDFPEGSVQVDTKLLGGFNVSNVLATLAACYAVGVDPAVAAAALRELRGVPGRLEHLGGGEKPDVFVDYAHTPDALERALEALRPLAPERLVVVFGCGGDRDREKRPQMGEAASRIADYVIVTSDNPRTESPDAIIDDIEPGLSGEWKRVVDRRDAILEAVRGARPTDVVLVAGKGHETYQEVGTERRPFDDVSVVNEALT